MPFSRLRAIAIPFVCLAGCRGTSDRPLFQLLSPQQTGITFANTITTSDSLNVQRDVYVYNGAGVAVGDIDNDGLPDIFFAGNMVSSRLYLNKGQMRFDDITERAGVGTRRWATGATMMDINDDGYLDIYVSVSGPEWSKPEERANLLFVNNKDGTFTEAAARYGVADTGFSTHAVFLDYNGDGCLDLFVLNNSPKDFSRAADISHPAGIRTETPGGYNELYRNSCRGQFTNVSKEAGILRDAGYGLGVAVADLNEDGWPDIYVSNDATPNDVLYVNNGNGTFTNRAGRWLKHASMAGMGVDIADFNNDGWADILQMDMMPRDLIRRKRMSGYMTYDGLLDTRQRGFRDDYSENTLQLSSGVTRTGDVIFSDVARLAGVAATDWSWSPLFADFDNDGYKDILITNGYPKAVNDLDYQTAIFALRRNVSRRAASEMLSHLHTYDLPNYVFRNKGDLTFSDQTKAWGLDQPSFSYGAAYADLDNDGRLDLVVNNIDASAFVYHNVGGTNDDAHHYLQIKLEGDSAHRWDAGIGARLVVTVGAQKQYLYYSPYRGYMSTMDGRAHFGLGRASRVDTLGITWPDGSQQVLTDLNVDRLLIVEKKNAVAKNGIAKNANGAKDASTANGGQAFEPMDPLRSPAYKHPASAQIDYVVQPLLPYMISRRGPALAVADVDGDGIEDLFVGGGSGVPGKLFMQQKDGSYVVSSQGQPFEADKAFEDWGALFFDANGDGRPDLYVASGGYSLLPNSPLLQDRLYINQGGGRFARDVQALPVMLTSTATVRAGDFNGDGRPDLFVGGRLTPRKYPYPTRSYVLRNDGGRFTDVTEQIAPELAFPGGMITDAIWTDFDGDKRVDLVTVGEWMPIQFYRNDGKRLRDVTKSTGLPRLRGLWFSVAAGDFDNDGRPDIVAGNLGLNYTYTTSRDTLFGIYAADFAARQTTDVILTQEIDGTAFPFAGYVPLGREIYTLGVRFRTYGAFAQAPLGQMFSSAELRQAIHYQADTFASVYLHNHGGGRFSSASLPNLAQIAPIKSMVAHDVDGDGHVDVILAGNLYDAEPNTARADAGNGLWLKGDGGGGEKQGSPFTAVPTSVSGLLTPLNVSGLALIHTPTGMALLVANIGDSLQTFRIRNPR